MADHGVSGVGRAVRLISKLLGHFDIVCDACGAGWVGVPGEPCSWCERVDQAVNEHQRHLLLNPELPDFDDAHYDTAVAAWAERLQRGVDIDLIDEADARDAYETRRREVTDAA